MDFKENFIEDLFNPVEGKACDWLDEENLLILNKMPLIT